MTRKIDLPITLKIEAGEAGLIHLTSPSHPEIFVSGTSIAEVLCAAPTVIAAINKARGEANRRPEFPDWWT